METRESRIATRREIQNHSQNIVNMRAGLPDTIPARVIARDQIQHELTLRNEDELQQLTGNRARRLNDPQVTNDAVVVARYLMRNNLLGELARSVENLALNATANQHLDLTVWQRAALEKGIDTSRARDAKNASAENELNLTSFDWTLDDGSKVTGLGKEISDIYNGPDALSNYLINRLQTQLVSQMSQPGVQALGGKRLW